MYNWWGNFQYIFILSIFNHDSVYISGKANAIANNLNEQ